MKRTTTISLLGPAILAATLILGGCFDSPTGSNGNQEPFPPVNTAPFDRDLPEQAALTTVLQQGDTIYFFGGRDAGGRAVDSVWAFVLGSRTWITRAPMPTARYYAGAVSIGGHIFVIGGRDNTASAEQGDRVHRVVERYDPAADQWTTMPSVDAEGFDGTYPTYVATARGRMFAISTLMSSRTTWLYESVDGSSWTAHRLSVDAGHEPTLMSDGRDLLLITETGEYFGQGFYRIDPTTKRVDRDAPAYDWMRGYANRWIELDGYIYNVNGYGGEDNVLAVYNSPGTSWGFNSVPFDITTNRHFTPIVTDRGLGTLYFFAPPQLRIGVHYSTLENRFFTK